MMVGNERRDADGEAAELGENPGAELRVTLNLQVLGIGELARLLQDLAGKRQLSDVVQ